MRESSQLDQSGQLTFPFCNCGKWTKLQKTAHGSKWPINLLFCVAWNGLRNAKSYCCIKVDNCFANVCMRSELQKAAVGSKWPSGSWHGDWHKDNVGPKWPTESCFLHCMHELWIAKTFSWIKVAIYFHISRQTCAINEVSWLNHRGVYYLWRLQN